MPQALSAEGLNPSNLKDARNPSFSFEGNVRIYLRPTWPCITYLSTWNRLFPPRFTEQLASASTARTRRISRHLAASKAPLASEFTHALPRRVRLHRKWHDLIGPREIVIDNSLNEMGASLGMRLKA